MSFTDVEAASEKIGDEKTGDDEPEVSKEKGSSRFASLRTPFSKRPPPPPKASIDDASLIPEATAGWFSFITFEWLTPLLSLGYARPLEASDLYKLQDSRSAKIIGDKINASYETRSNRAAEYNTRLASGQISPGWRAAWWFIRGNKASREKQWREKDGRKRASLVLALNDSVAWWFWSGGFLKLVSDIATILTPLVVKALISFATESFEAHRGGRHDKTPPVGRGIGLAFALLAMQVLSSICQNHFFYRSTTTGVLLRGGLITAIYDRSLRLTTRARTTLTNGKLVNHISTDVSRIDFCCGLFHLALTAPFQMVICLILLILNLGPSALAGFAFFVLCTPMQAAVMKRLMVMRQKSMVWTDKRAKLLQELLGGMKIIKFFAWEIPYLKRIGEYRTSEMGYIRTLLVIRAANNAVAMALPVLASVLSFVAYSLSGHTLDPARIFASLTLFQLLRLPLMLLPLTLGAIADAQNALKRLNDVFEAEVLTESKTQDAEMDAAVTVVDGDFTWDSPPPEVLSKNKRQKALSTKPKPVGGPESKEKVFQLKDINLAIPEGKLTAIVGPVGTGKTSLLEAMIGEMRRTAGTVKFNGSVAYCPQSAWIQNATVRDNILFGRPFEEERYWKAVHDACLEADLEMLPNGDLTEVGERGISLSGGQKQRINIGRAMYVGADIQIFDDPLSALDAHVGKAVFNNVFLNASIGKTRILVTHALHFLPQVDYIFTVVDGRIAERGTYSELVAKDGAFSRFVKEFGSKDNQKEQEEEIEEDAKQVVRKKPQMSGTPMMQVEERNMGAVPGAIYKEYLKAGRGVIIIPLLLLSLVFLQGTQVMSSYWLVYWQEM